jgi:DNA sulfur modification protein DndB
MTAKHKKLPSLYLPALSCEMGNWKYFATSMRLADVAERIKYAEDLRHPERYDEWIQREIQPKRRKQITEYLLNHKERFFGSLVVTVYGGKPKWLDLAILDTEELRLEDLSPLTLLSIDKALGLLLLNGEEDLFPIDGQHRLSGIKEAVRLSPQRGEDIVSVLFVADRGRVETRRLFSTLNRYAVPVNKGERIILDEDDGMAITTRHLIEDYPLFSKKRVAPPKRTSLAETDQSFTTAFALYRVNTILCAGYEKGKEWQKGSLTGPQRPTDEQLKSIYELVVRFWDLMAESFPPVRSVQNQSFEKVIAKNRHKNGGHLLFRPAGQMAFARAIRMLHSRDVKMESAFKAFRKVRSLELTSTPWVKVLWQPFPDDGGGTMITTVGAQNLVAKLLLFLGGFLSSKEEIADLLTAYRKSLDDPEARLPKPH